MPASICYVEIPAEDIEKAGAFYTDVFGWEVKPSEMDGTRYWEFKSGDGLKGGLVHGQKAVDGGAVVYLKVEDIDATLRTVEAKGGKVVRAKFDIGCNHGFSALFTDPNGNRLGLFARA